MLALFWRQIHTFVYILIKIVQSKIQIICTALFSFSDETADDLNARGGGGGPGSKWGLSRQSSGAGGAGVSNRARGDSQEITYVPTSVLKGHPQGGTGTAELRRNPNGQEVSVSTN